MCRTQGSGLPAWIRLRRNQNPATAATPPTNSQNAFHRSARGTRNGTPIAKATATPQIVSFDPSAMPIARPATRIAPNGAAAGGGPEGGGPGGRDPRAAQALIRIAVAARSIATGTVSVAGVPASRGTIGPVSIAIATAVSESGAAP